MEKSGFASRRMVVAVGFFDRLRGLLATRPEGCVLVLAPCRSVHTFGMRHPIDVAFCDVEGRVLRAQRSVGPRRVLSCRGACFVLEQAYAESLAWVQPGDRLALNAQPIKRDGRQQAKR